MDQRDLSRQSQINRGIELLVDLEESSHRASRQHFRHFGDVGLFNRLLKEQVFEA